MARTCRETGTARKSARRDLLRQTRPTTDSLRPVWTSAGQNQVAKAALSWPGNPDRPRTEYEETRSRVLHHPWLSPAFYRQAIVGLSDALAAFDRPALSARCLKRVADALERDHHLAHTAALNDGNLMLRRSR